MPTIIHNNLDKKAMDIFTDDQINTLDKAIQLIDTQVFISKIDYDEGIILIGKKYYEGTPNFYQKEAFITINVVCESVPGVFNEVFNRVYDRCL